MKHKMTLEEGDLRSYVEKVLAMHGVKAAEPIVFRSGKGQAVKGLHIDINCEMAPEEPNCPLCGISRTTRPVVAVAQVSAARNAGVNMSEEPSYSIDESMGESTVPPGQENYSGDDDDDSLPSMASIAAVNARLTREREVEKMNRKKTPKYTSGESNRPPKGGL